MTGSTGEKSGKTVDAKVFLLLSLSLSLSLSLALSYFMKAFDD
jgi:hypothetical protein